MGIEYAFRFNLPTSEHDSGAVQDMNLIEKMGLQIGEQSKTSWDTV
jgi:hypothetical protein